MKTDYSQNNGSCSNETLERNNEQNVIVEGMELPLSQSTLEALGNFIYYKSYYFKGDDVVDRAATIKWMLKSIIDGRPQPFSLDVSDRFIPNGDEKIEALDDLLYFAETGELSKKYPTECAATIGGESLDLGELISLRDWINTVITWHQRDQ